LSAPEINRTIAAAAIIHAASNKKNNTQEPVVVTLSDDGHGGSIRLSLGEHGYRSFHVDSSSSTYGGDLALRITPLDRASGEEVAAEAVTVTLAAAEVAAMTKHSNRLAVDLVGDGHGSQVPTYLVGCCCDTVCSTYVIHVVVIHVCSYSRNTTQAEILLDVNTASKVSRCVFVFPSLHN
jgi:hypothetical protein